MRSEKKGAKIREYCFDISTKHIIVEIARDQARTQTSVKVYRREAEKERAKRISLLDSAIGQNHPITKHEERGSTAALPNKRIEGWKISLCDLKDDAAVK